MSSSGWCEMRISAEQFKGLVEFSGQSYRSIAEAVTRELRKDRNRPALRCSHTVISKLANGQARTVHPRRAREIERALNVPSGHIFLMQLSRVSQHDRTVA